MAVLIANNPQDAVDLGSLKAIESSVHVPFQLEERHAVPRAAHHTIVGTATTMPGERSRKLRLILMIALAEATRARQILPRLKHTVRSS
jgi:hypothetical protein